MEHDSLPAGPEDFRSPAQAKAWLESQIRPQLESLHTCAVKWAGNAACNTNVEVPTIRSFRQDGTRPLSLIRQHILVIRDWALRLRLPGPPVAPSAFANREEAQACFSEWCAYLEQATKASGFHTCDPRVSEVHQEKSELPVCPPRWPSADSLLAIADAADRLAATIRTGLLTTDPNCPARLPGFVENEQGVSGNMVSLTLLLYEEAPPVREYLNQHPGGLVAIFPWPVGWDHSVVQPLSAIRNLHKAFWYGLPGPGPVVADPSQHPLWEICRQAECWCYLSGMLWCLDKERVPSLTSWHREKGGWVRDLEAIREHPPLPEMKWSSDSRLVRADEGIPAEWLTALETYARQLRSAITPESIAKTHSPNDAVLAFFRLVRTEERNGLLRALFPEGIGPYEQEKVVARIRRYFPEVSREELYRMNPGQLAVYLKMVLDQERGGRHANYR